MTQGRNSFLNALKAFKPRPGLIPTPGSPWEAWTAHRLDKLENQNAWMFRLIVGALILQVGLQVLGMLS